MRREEPLTTSVDLTGFTDVRADALRAHATQVDPTSRFWFGLPPDVLRELYPFDDYFLAGSRVGPSGPGVEEDDLFAGLR
jgi:mycothiol S-conjugate amidase